MNDACRTLSGSKCRFPFRYLGVLHQGCISLGMTDASQTWCSTKTDWDNDHQEGNWGFCNLEGSPKCREEELEGAANYLF